MAVSKVSIVLLALLHASFQQSHYHSHGHEFESPHYKYSREANEQEVLAESRGDFHHHEHSHEYHRHSKEHVHDASDHHHTEEETIRRYNQRLSSKEETYASKPFDPNGMLSFMNNFRIRVWVYSIGSTLLISFAPFLILSLIPVQVKSNTADSEPLLKVLLSFGSGGLLGDAFLHLIPHSQPSHQHSHVHSHSHTHSHSHESHEMDVGTYVLAGIIAFLTVEKLVRILRAKHIINSHAHSHSHGQDILSVKKKKIVEKSEYQEESKERSSASSMENSTDDSDEEKVNLVRETVDHDTGFEIAAYLNMAADFAHNFTDGLAIGASFLAGTTVGVVTTITVLVHEVPHEIGDFAILVQSGFTKSKAMFVQLLTALGALTGCALSLSTSGASNTASSNWILPFTAGGFIYIATVSVIPELLQNSSTWQSIKEVLALLTGIMLMYVIAAYE
ncbi:unnamed protein product [Thelazia callipaeda]|uniref:Zinc transporter SLC39A7 n=1 Tax=Thelazia callipaeda TaxID=103827 RepID=A0A0N5CXH1_THECL|nr:unnamed protein product [Thelazia callipaeda]